MLAWFADNTLAAAALAAIVLLACRVRRLSPAAEHALWLLVLLKLLTPAWVAWPCRPLDVCGDLGFRESERAGGSVLVAETPVASRESLSASGVEAPRPAIITRENQTSGLAGAMGPAVPTTVSLQPRPQVSPHPKPSDHVRRSVPSWLVWLSSRWEAVVLSLWAAGALAVLTLQSARAFRFRKLIARGEAPPAWFADELGRLAERLRMRAPAARVVAGLGCPVVWCLGRPRLLVPADLLGDYEPGRVRGILLHELAHLRRRDHWVIWLEIVAAWLWWWNPLFWYVRRRIRQCAEMACDAWVVWALPNQRRSYADSLIDVLQVVSQRPAAAPAWGAIGESRRNLERRLTMIFQANVPRSISRVGVIGIGLLALVVLPGWSGAQVSEEQQAETATGQAAAVATAERGDVHQVGEGEAEAGVEVAEEVQVEAGGPSNPLSAGDDSTYPGSQPARKHFRPPAPKTIKVFRLKHRDPAEMLEIVTALVELTKSRDDVASGEVRILAVLKTVRPPRGYGFGMPGSGAVGPYGGEMSTGYGSGYSEEHEEDYEVGDEGMGPDGYPGGGYPGMMSGVSQGTRPARTPLRLAIDMRTRALIARGTKAAVDQVAELIAALDTPDDSLPARFEKLENLQVIKFQHRRKEDMIRILQELGIAVQVTQVPMRPHGAAYGYMPGAASYEEEFVGQRGGMFIAAGPEQDLKQIEELIKSLDVGDKPTGTSGQAMYEDMMEAEEGESPSRGRSRRGRTRYGTSDEMYGYDEMMLEYMEGFEEDESSPRGRSRRDRR